MWWTKRRRAQNDEDYETWIDEGVCPTLNAFDNTGDSRATVLIAFDNSYRDGLRIQKGETINTLSAKMGSGGNNVPFVAIPIQGTIIGRQDHNGPAGKGFGDPGDPSYTLDSISQHRVATEMQVRRLTPIECERLMGWPDNHTLNRADGKTNSDTTRYKMCGNGVASPVAQWIAQQINTAENGL
jgi:DNA (cytosine-5)-methyltransferase 1